jgi:hypothetical protein
MRKKSKSPSKIEVFSNIAPGMSASYSVGSDSYGYWISKVDYKNGIIACYSPDAKFTIDWQDGDMTAEPFDPTHVPDIQLKYRYGCWYEYHRPTDSWNRTYFKNLHISKDSPRIYRDPSF